MSTERLAYLSEYFKDHPEKIARLVSFDSSADKLYPFDFTAGNSELGPSVFGSIPAFTEWIELKLEQSGSRYGIGGYNEHRVIYSRSELFDAGEEPRRLHLGVDIWGPAGTMVFAPLDGRIHSFRYNDKLGDYGATVILEHHFAGITFHTLYGHLNLASLDNLVKDAPVALGEQIAEFGNVSENGHWPPHLHFQVILDMKGLEGDYPGVCRYSDRDTYLTNSPDPDFLLKRTFI